ncbi:MAG TPA: protein-export chaperone SecB [Devosiaceae bacterium]
MADETPNAADKPEAGATPALNIVGQYIRDLSFENPGAPASVVLGNGNPEFNVSINVGVRKQADELYAVELNMSARAERDKQLLFNIELVYGGLFRVRGVPEAELPMVLMIECPRQIFPFARQVLASTTQAGGFPPLLMEPVDFIQLYRQNVAAMAAAQSQANAEGGSGSVN